MRGFILAVCLVAALSARSEAKSHAQPFKAPTGAFFALSVQNMAESVQWYSEKLGLSVVFEVRGGVDVTVLEGEGLIVELIRDPAARPAIVARPELLYGVFKAGFLVKDFEDTVQELRARGVQIAFGPFPARDNQRANVIVRDNEGNLLQIFGR